MGDRSKSRDSTGKAEPRGAPARRHAVPAPSTDPATNLLIADVALGAMASFLHRKIKRDMVRADRNAKESQETGKGRTVGRSLAHLAAGRIAARSIPGAILVAGVLFGKAAFDRSQAKRQAQRTVRKAAEDDADKA